MEGLNPFALVRASDYTDAQINSLWVELGAHTINAVIEPKARISKFILGGKGSGKTHLLRYFSYPVARLRHPKKPGLSIVRDQRFLAVFMRATGLDAARFEHAATERRQWQQLFGVYLELRLAEVLLEALCDIESTSPDEVFDGAALVEALSDTVSDKTFRSCDSVIGLRDWATQQRRRIDDAVNNAAFSGTLDIRVPFAIGGFCLLFGKALPKWNVSFEDSPLIYLVDEIENFSESQQQVINSLIRYGGGTATFRVTGRLYARKTLSTLADGEENREGAEFKTTYLDDILRSYTKYPEFARKFIAKRLLSVGVLGSGKKAAASIEPESFFEEIKTEEYYGEALVRWGFHKGSHVFLKPFGDALAEAGVDEDVAKDISRTLTNGFPAIIQKLNLLRFCKKFKKTISLEVVAKGICREAGAFVEAGERAGGSYANHYGHWASDMFAQLCRESKKQGGVPYAGFGTFVRMSSGNPRNLLIILGKIYELASFRELDFIRKDPLSVSIQTEAAMEGARFMFERDTNYGRSSDLARDATARLGTLLRTARYALNVPEVSPLAVSFSEEDLSVEARRILDSALNYSFVFEVSEGRPDRNSKKVNRKIQLNPLLSPRWGLPVARRGDIALGKELANAIFAPDQQARFELQLKNLQWKWNNPFSKSGTICGAIQERLL